MVEECDGTYLLQSAIAYQFSMQACGVFSIIVFGKSLALIRDSYTREIIEGMSYDTSLKVDKKAAFEETRKSMTSYMRYITFQFGSIICILIARCIIQLILEYIRIMDHFKRQGHIIETIISFLSEILLVLMLVGSFRWFLNNQAPRAGRPKNRNERLIHPLINSMEYSVMTIEEEEREQGDHYKNKT